MALKNQIIEKAISYAKDNLSEDLSIARIAKHLGYSESYFMGLYKKTTGESFYAGLLRWRIEKARQYLQETRISVSEIALQVGFNSYTAFEIAFKKQTGLSPKAFRNRSSAVYANSNILSKAIIPADENIFFRDTFDGNQKGQWWEPERGQWAQSDKCLTGISEEFSNINFREPLPENFRIRLGAWIRTADEVLITSLYLNLMDASAKKMYASIPVGKPESPSMQIEIWIGSRTLEGYNDLASETWTEIELTLQDDLLRLRVNGGLSLEIRDPFPPPYADRCRIGIQAFSTEVRIRKWEIMDLGFSPLVQAIRQGDALFISESFARAREFYFRQIRSGSNVSNAMELRYKIGMTFFREENFVDAEQWFSKVVTKPENDFWARKARLALLELDWRQKPFDIFVENLRQACVLPVLQTGIRILTATISGFQNSRGFSHESVLLFEKLRTQNSLSDSFSTEIDFHYAQALYQANRLEEAKNIFMELSGNSSMVGEKIQAWHQIADILTYQGKFAESSAYLQKILEHTHTHYWQIRCHVIEAFNLRGNGKLDQAVDLLAGLFKKYPHSEHEIAFANLHRIYLLCMMGQKLEAENLVKETERLFPGWPKLTGPVRGLNTYMLEIPDQNYEMIAKLLGQSLDMAKTGLPVRTAQTALLSAVFWELAGKKEKSQKLFLDIAKWFPPQRCAFYGSVAEQLAKGDADDLEKAPFANSLRSELLFLGGLLYESRQNLKRARELFEASVKEDRSLRWPAFWAKKKVRIA